MDKQWLIVIIQIILVLLLVAIITFFIRLSNAIKLEKRIAKYSVRHEKNSDDLALVDKIWARYIKFVKKQRKKIKKMAPNLTRRYDKYIMDTNSKPEDYVTHKIVISLLFVALTIIAMSLQGQFVSLIQIFFSLIIGFYLLDIYLIIRYKLSRKRIENDMLRAIIIMNNAFKSGKSTIQAVEIVGKKMPAPIGYEFKKIYEEMKYGLAVDTVFDRFAKRVNVEEAEYLSSSLTILNRTGGNIIAVFDSIEKTLFDKKKLKEELKSSTLLSKLVVRILLFVPVVFVLIIYLLNPDYFDPFFESTAGYILLGIIFIMFIVYAYLLDRIVKVNY